MANELRRLTAIVAADVAGYSRLVGRDESGTVGRLGAARTELLEPVVSRRGGRIVKLTGDGALMEFTSAVEALSAAIEFQQSMVTAESERPADERLVFRIGVHSGDVIVQGTDIYGDGVNIAARLESEAPPGGVIVSGPIFEATVGRVSAEFEDLGRLSLKNIERPVQAYAVRWKPGAWTNVRASQPAGAPTMPPHATPLPLPDKPSIAVLPFQNRAATRNRSTSPTGWSKTSLPHYLASADCSSSRGIRASSTRAEPSTSARSGASLASDTSLKGVYGKRQIGFA